MQAWHTLGHHGNGGGGAGQATPECLASTRGRRVDTRACMGTVRESAIKKRVDRGCGGGKWRTYI